MVVLGIESSSPIASVALVSGHKLWGEMTLNIGLTHSEQLLPLIDDLLQQTKVTLADLEGIAVSGGPGSFTGLRIGMATAKGLAQGLKIPLVSVSTLLALAYQQAGCCCLVSSLMNARKNEVYAALFRFTAAGYEQLEPEQALSPHLWAQKLAAYQKAIVLTGDGGADYEEIWQETLGKKAVFPPAFTQLARGASVAWLGQQKLGQGEQDDLFTLIPMYIRSSEAERRLKGVGNR
ncbi:MAG: tRNA (adenosine(37)-N6)-threonylcarbamoyltransferase complex dimerization subunit type 1 TsaB [Eubacteriales bacterium]|nr:tRNA (adenosine(37)-N6)-threonylcarbamoyltransferase complex dimerization subunit type 1 TsaB [Eubacteriales bacterium]